jgi:immune inhibitor A
MRIRQAFAAVPALILLLCSSALAGPPPRGGGSAVPTADVAPALMPLDPEIVQRYASAGRDVPVAITEQRFAGRAAVTVNRLERQSFPTASALKAIVLLVRFTGSPPGGPAVPYSPGVWDSMLFGTTYVRGGADPSTDRTLKNFLSEISYGTVNVVTVNLPSAVGWVTAPNAYTYYCAPDGTHDNGFGPYPRNVQRLVMDAVNAANPYVDFSQYAAGGVVQNLFVVHAGSGAEWSGGPALIWSHAWDISSGDGWGNTLPPLYADGVRIAGYSMEPEAGGNTLGEEGGAVTGPFLPTVGVYAHEFGHVLGLPDEYDYGYESNGTGRVSLMAGGSWNRAPNVYPECAGNAPAHPSAWGIARLGFVTPVTVTAATPGIVLPPIETAPVMYKVEQSGTAGKEYWLFENRQQLGFDQGFARMGSTAHGLCVYHMDENVLGRAYWRPNEAECVSDSVYSGLFNCDCDTLPASSGNGEKWYGIALEQADGLYQLELGTSGGDWRDFWSAATGKTEFGPATNPNTSSYYGCTALVAAANIAEVGQDIVCDLTPDSRAYTLDVAVAGDGAVTRSPDLTAYVHGDTVTLEAVPGAGYGFVEWGGDLSGAANPAALVMDANKSVTATFADVAAPVVDVIAPDGGEMVFVDSLATLRWSATDNAGVTAVDVLLSRSGAGGPYDTLAAGVANSGALAWTVTEPVTPSATPARRRARPPSGSPAWWPRPPGRRSTWRCCRCGPRPCAAPPRSSSPCRAPRAPG